MAAGDEERESLGVSGREVAEGDHCGLGELISTPEPIHGQHAPSWRGRKQGRIRCLGLVRHAGSCQADGFLSPWGSGAGPPLSPPNPNSRLVFLLL